MPHSQVSSNNPSPEPNQSNSRIDTYLFKIYSNIVFPSTPKGLFHVGLPVKILITLPNFLRSHYMT